MGLWARDSYEMVVDEGEARINYHHLANGWWQRVLILTINWYC